jgi:hypothetical protein
MNTAQKWCACTRASTVALTLSNRTSSDPTLEQPSSYSYSSMTTTAYGALPVAASSSSYSHTVCRSAELLSCAKTAVKIAQGRHAKQQLQHESNGGTSTTEQQQQWFTHINPADLELHNVSLHSQQPSEVLEDGLTLLRTMESELKHLEGLVRRRGHTNDPTQEISAAVSALEQDAAELTRIIQTMVPLGVGVGQRQRHWKAVQQWFQAAAQQHAAKLKEILAVRGTVLAEQARRRQRFQTTPSASGVSTQSSAAANALFSLPPPKPVAPLPKPAVTAAPTPLTPQQQSSLSPSYSAVNGQQPSPAATMTNGSNSAAFGNNTMTAVTPSRTNAPPAARSGNTGGYSYYGGSGSGYGGGVRTAGYGGSASNVGYYTGSNSQYTSSTATTGNAATGMRQRRSGAENNNNAAQQQQLALQQRQLERQTASRMNEARQAEKSLVELGTVFGKMSTLISQQSETLEKVEDDVEAAYVDVSAGHSEITILYSIKKGNRPLILKVFGLLIFLILFMRIYAK